MRYYQKHFGLFFFRTHCTMLRTLRQCRLFSKDTLCAQRTGIGQRQLNVCVMDGVNGVDGAVTQMRQKHALYMLKVEVKLYSFFKWVVI